MSSVGQKITVSSLQKQFAETKRTLREVEVNIKKISGSRLPRGFNFPAQRTNKRSNGSATGRNQESLPRKRKLNSKKASEEGRMPAPEDDSSDEESSRKKPSLKSTVAAVQNNVEPKKDMPQGQKLNDSAIDRTRRMFGMVLGTLQKFQREEVTRKEQSQKRAEIERKVEEAQEKEREEAKIERQELLLAKKQKQIEIQCIEKKLEIAEEHEKWSNQQKVMMNFIKTKADPRLMYCPAKHDSESLRRLNETQQEIQYELDRRNVQFERKLLEIEECYRKDEVRHQNSKVRLKAERKLHCVSEEIPAMHPDDEMEVLEEEENGRTEKNGAGVDAEVQDEILECVADEVCQLIYDD